MLTQEINHVGEFFRSSSGLTEDECLRYDFAMSEILTMGKQ
jgi:hypothetical protein